VVAKLDSRAFSSVSGEVYLDIAVIGENSIGDVYNLRTTLGTSTGQLCNTLKEIALQGEPAFRGVSLQTVPQFLGDIIDCDGSHDANPLFKNCNTSCKTWQVAQR
jgi:hypothetical protein